MELGTWCHSISMGRKWSDPTRTIRHSTAPTPGSTTADSIVFLFSVRLRRLPVRQPGKYPSPQNGRQQNRGKCIRDRRFVVLPPGPRTTTFSDPLLGLHRHHMLDCAAHTPDLEELSFKVYRWFVRLVGVSQTSPVHVNEGLTLL